MPARTLAIQHFGDTALLGFLPNHWPSFASFEAVTFMVFCCCYCVFLFFCFFLYFEAVTFLTLLEGVRQTLVSDKTFATQLSLAYGEGSSPHLDNFRDREKELGRALGQKKSLPICCLMPRMYLVEDTLFLCKQNRS